MSYKDTDYLAISTRIRVLENSLLTRARMERMLDARSDAEALKVLAECGYTLPEDAGETELNAVLAQRREQVFADLDGQSPNPALVDAFRLKYDYHNAKVLLKAAAKGEDAGRLLVDAGTVPAQALQNAIRQQEYGSLPEALADAIQQAGETLGSTQDPQRCDFLLDRAYWAQLSQLAKASESPMLAGYVARMIDCANLKAAVRSLRLGKEADFMRLVLVDGGGYSPESILQAAYAGTLDTACAQMGQAAQLAPQAAKGNQITAFEKACDDYLTSYLQSAKLTPFGDSVIIAYLAAREAEFTAARVIMAGRFAGLEPDIIRERLRESYV